MSITFIEFDIDVRVVFAFAGSIHCPTAGTREAADMRCCEGKSRTILTAETGLAGPCITQLGLESPFAVGIARGVAVERREMVGMLLIERRQEVESSGNAVKLALRAERHVIRALHLRQQRESAAGIRERSQECVSVAVGEVILGCGVIGLIGIFNEDVPPFPLPLRADIPCPHPLREVIAV